MIIVDPHPRDTAPGSADAELGDARTINYLRISVTDRCNLRCRYCMPEDQTFLDRDRLLSFEEIAQVASVLVERGVRKIRITGGEPLLRRDLALLVGMLKALPNPPEVALTTNAMLLDRHAAALRDAGLDRLNVSLDTLNAERFERLARRPGLPAVMRGLDAAERAGFAGTKLNTVVMGGFNDDELGDMLAFSNERGFEQRFIEFMPMTSNSYGLDATRVPLSEIRARIEQHGELAPRQRGTGPADTFTLSSTGQRVGIIAAISLPFCETCNRVRLTSEGVLRSCLFDGGEVSIREMVRSGDLRDGLIESLEWLRRVKPPVHDGVGHVQMNRVGG
ncbi:MAG: cyclic pyranopterin monophosphate synthase [Planctomycetota bacterium]|nr:MAG: cyclic pyranopterin monophosphate synthase [Planctomycetota bacterium]